MRGLLALIAIEVARLAASRARTGVVTLAPADATVEALRRLVEEHFRKERLISFYAEKLAITPDRLNDHVKRVERRHRRSPDPPARADRSETRAGLHRPADPRSLLRLGFADPSHLARFFRKQTGMTPQNSARAGAAEAAVLAGFNGPTDRPLRHLSQFLPQPASASRKAWSSGGDPAIAGTVEMISLMSSAGEAADDIEGIILRQSQLLRGPRRSRASFSRGQHELLKELGKIP